MRQIRSEVHHEKGGETQSPKGQKIEGASTYAGRVRGAPAR